MFFLFSISSQSWSWHKQCRNIWKYKCNEFCKLCDGRNSWRDRSYPIRLKGFSIYQTEV